MVAQQDHRANAVSRALRLGLGTSALALATMLAACGGGGGGTISTPAPAPAPVPAPPPAPAPAPAPPPAPPPSSSFNTAEYRRSGGPQQHGAITAWEAGRTGAGQTIAIIDTGIDATSPEFAGRIVASSRDVTTGGRSIQAQDDHGTNVALVAAGARNGVGIMGIAFDASLMVLRADAPGSCTDTTSTDEASCSFFDSSIARGIDAAVSGGARVINLSLGGNDGIGGSVRDAVVRASSAGVVVVVAAGNGGAGNRPGTDPNKPSLFASQLRAAGGSNVIIVGSVDEGNQISSFSQRAGGDAAWFLTARGERVCCVYENGQIFVGRDAGGSYNLLFSGTSFAAPQVAGAVALLGQAFPNLSGQQIVRILLDSARDAGAAGVDATYGTGVLDIAAALAPRGALTLAGGTAVVRAGMETGLGSAAMGDAMARSDRATGVALDSYQRAYQIDLASGLRGAALQPRLRAALATGARVAGGAAGGVSLAFSVGEGSTDRRTPWAQQLQLSGEQAEGARLLAARVAARIAPDTEIAFGLREGAGGLTAQLQGAHQPAFLIARDAGGDSGFLRQGEAGFALHRQIGQLGVTASAETGSVWRNDDLRAMEAMPGGPRDRFGYHAFALAAQRRIGGIDTTVTASWLGEEASVLGATFAPVFGLRGADSLFLDASAGFALGDGWRMGAAWRQGWSQLRGGGLMAAGSRLATNGWSVDLSRADSFTSGDSVGFRLSQPLRVTGGGIGLTLPVAYDYATLAPTYGTRFVPLAPFGREIDAELAWRGPLWGGDASASVFYRSDPGHYAALPDDKGVALRWRRDF